MGKLFFPLVLTYFNELNRLMGTLDFILTML